jgi:hypothetical protein
VAKEDSIPESLEPHFGDPSSPIKTAQLLRVVAAERDYVDGQIGVLEERFRGIDRASSLLSETVNRTPTEIQKEIGHLRSIIDERSSTTGIQFKERDIRMDAIASDVTRIPGEVISQVEHLKSVQDEKFNSISLQFAERDIRTSQARDSDAQALAAALQAAKELVGSQGEATAASAVKSETSFTKQIDQIGTIIQTLEKALDARITELKERIDRGEGNNAGARETRVEQRGVNMQTIAIIALFATVLGGVLARALGF